MKRGCLEAATATQGGDVTGRHEAKWRECWLRGRPRLPLGTRWLNWRAMTQPTNPHQAGMPTSMSGMWAEGAPWAAPDLSRRQAWGLALAVVALHGLLAWAVWHRASDHSLAAEPVPIEVSLITSDEAIRPAPSAVVSPPPALPRTSVPTPVPATPPPLAPTRVRPDSPVLASARPAERNDAQAVVAPEPARSANTAQAAPTPPPAAAPAPMAAQPAAAAEAPRQVPPHVLTGSAVRYLVRPVLQYPRVSRDLGESGAVSLRVLVDEQGRPKEVEILKSCGFPRLDQQAVQAMKAARFQPLIEDGAPRAAWVTPGPLVFNLEEQ